MNHSNFKLLAKKRELVLGSGSPRRLALLTDMGVEFTQTIPRLEEKQLSGEQPYVFAQRLAEAKARWVGKHMEQNQIVLSCDTIVILDGSVLGKPTDENEAFEILSTLAGKQHVVCTAVALATGDRFTGDRFTGDRFLVSDYETTEVYFNDVTSDQIKEYISSGEPMDKAGAYGIQGMGAFLVDRISGNLDNVIGLPRELLDELAKKVNRML
ncbi:MAG: Maf family protein [candidate division Zixibacteria bacterium]|nr:Maf family protein [candidate division Zixibacteria bacterium]